MCMANRLSNRLNRLIREHAYLSGSLPDLMEDVRLAEASLATKTKCLELSLQRLIEVDQQITALSAIDVSKIATIRQTPRVGKQEYGALRGTILDIMKNGRPIKTSDLLRLLAPVFEWDLTTNQGRDHARHAVIKPLGIFQKKGVVEKLADEVSESGQRCGVWRWIGPPDTDNPTAQKKTADL